MNWGPWLFLLALAICSDIVASVILIRKLRIAAELSRTGLARRLEYLFLGVLTEGVCQFIAAGFGYTVKPGYTVGFGISFWIGRAARSAAIWAFVIFMTGRHNGKR